MYDHGGLVEDLVHDVPSRGEHLDHDGRTQDQTHRDERVRVVAVKGVREHEDDIWCEQDDIEIEDCGKHYYTYLPTQSDVRQVCDDGGGQEHGVQVGELLVRVLGRPHPLVFSSLQITHYILEKA